jgi:hypothetical protein
MSSREAADPDDPPFVLTAHAVAALAERGIDLDWVERVLRRPERTEMDRDDPALRHVLGRIEERDNRVLRVVYNPTTRPWRLVTVFFDRRLRNRL